MVHRRVGSVNLIQFFMLEYNLTQPEGLLATVTTALLAVTDPQNSTGTQPNWGKVLPTLPSTWTLTPVKDKRPLRDNWQHENPLTREQLLFLMQQGQKLKGKDGKQWHCHWTGIGLRLGTSSNGLLAIDCDGHEALTKLRKLSNNDIPDTVAWTSGKEGRGQLLYQIPTEYWDKIKTTKIDCGEGQFLEFRWNGTQSVLPPSRHPETGQYYWIKSPETTEVAIAPQWLLDFLIAQSKRENEPKQPLLTQPRYHPSTHHNWTDEDWARSYLDALSSYRADHYDQWVQVGMALHSVSDCLLSDWDSWSRHSSKYKEGECEKKWRSFNDTGGITVASLAQWAYEDGWTSPWKNRSNHLKNLSTATSRQSQDSIMTTAQSQHGQIPLKDAVTAHIQSGLKASDRISAIFNLSIQYQIPSNQLERYWRELEAEIESEPLKGEHLAQLQNILNSHNQHLDVARIFPKTLANLMTNCAKAMPGPVEGLVVTLLAAAAGCAGTAAEVVVKASSNYVQPCLIRTLLLAETGEMKTPMQKVILDPIKQLEKEAFKAYREELKNYEEAKAKGEAQNLPQPIQQRYLLIDATPEKMVKIHAESTKGFLVYQDEWGSYLKGFNKYRNGQGNDRELDLSEFNGDTYIRDRVGDDSVFIDKMSISRTSGYQTSLFQEMVEKRDDLDGFLPRWLVSAPSFPPAYKDFINDEHDEVKQLSEHLHRLYRSLRQLTPQSYLLTLDAKKHFQTWQHHLVDLTRAEMNLLMKAVYPKIESYTARLALVLHLIDATSEGKTPEPIINGQTMEKAIYLAQYFLDQARWLYCPKNANPVNGLSGMMAQIQMFAANKGGAIAARQVKQAIASVKNSAKATANLIRQIFGQLAEAGYGILHGSGIHLQYEASGNQLDKVGQPQMPKTFRLTDNLTTGCPTLSTFNVSQKTYQQNQQNPSPIAHKLNTAGLSAIAQNVDNSHQQKSTSTFSVRVTLEGMKLEGQGRFAESGMIQVTLASGLTISVPDCACEIVDDFVDVDENVDTPINTLEASRENNHSQNVDGLIENDEPEIVDWESFPIEAVEEDEPITMARRVRKALLACRSREQLNSFLIGCQEFTDEVITWVLENFLRPNEFEQLEAILFMTTSD
jgi:Protein of unknown function (DUF3987)/Bifunctional DNA primase/polymerase, N-terminal/Primase C terminal 2 (PriCT-2)